MFGLDQLIDVAEDLLVVHITTVGGPIEPRSPGPWLARRRFPMDTRLDSARAISMRGSIGRGWLRWLRLAALAAAGCGWLRLAH